MTYKRKETIGDATQRVRIYALCGPEDIPRYVGKTIRPPHNRFKAHLTLSRRKAPHLPVHRWMAKQEEKGEPFTIIHLEYIDGGDWRSRERWWIAEMRRRGCRLLNICDGGEGAHGRKMSQGHKDKIADALKTGAYFSCEVCGKEFWRKKSAIEKGNARFCTRQCYFVWQRGKTKRMPKRD